MGCSLCVHVFFPCLPAAPAAAPGCLLDSGGGVCLFGTYTTNDTDNIENLLRLLFCGAGLEGPPGGHGVLEGGRRPRRVRGQPCPWLENAGARGCKALSGFIADITVIHFNYIITSIYVYIALIFGIILLTAFKGLQ